MDMQALECPGCGSTNIQFDAKTRRVICNQCGASNTYSRTTLNASGKVVYGKRNAVTNFLDAKFDLARHYALDVLNISLDHVPSLFIVAYCDEFREGRNGEMQRFFSQIQSVQIEYDELVDLRQLFMASIQRMQEYEDEVIELLGKNMQAPEDAQELMEFLDKFCPYLISKRTSSAFLGGDLLKQYKEAVQRYGIPKTCFALLKSIDTNPESPYVGNTFYLRAKAEYFFEHYVKAVGEILSLMPEGAYKEKFLRAYQQKVSQYQQSMNA